MIILYFFNTIYSINPFEVNFPYGVVAYSIWMILLALISKKTFKKSFDSTGWKFIFVVGLLCSITSFVLWFFDNMYTYNIDVFESLGFAIGSTLFCLGSFIFFICYLINFIVRFVRYNQLKKKDNILSE